MSITLHNFFYVFYYAKSIVQFFILPSIGQMSEEAQEARHKNISM